MSSLRKETETLLFLPFPSISQISPNAKEKYKGWVNTKSRDFLTNLLTLLFTSINTFSSCSENFIQRDLGFKKEKFYGGICRNSNEKQTVMDNFNSTNDLIFFILAVYDLNSCVLLIPSFYKCSHIPDMFYHDLALVNEGMMKLIKIYPIKPVYWSP